MTKTGFRYFIVLCIAILGCMLSTNAQVGQWDTTFFRGTGFVAAYDGAENPDSTIIVAGNFSYINQRAIRGLAKLNPDGTTDYTFNQGGAGTNNSVNIVTRLDNGQYIIGGAFTAYNGVTTNRIARINSDGTKDAAFATNLNGDVRAILIQGDSMIVAAGGFSTVNGAACSRITRLKYDGTRDTSFNPGTGANNNIWEVRRQADGKYIIAGEFTSYNGTTINRVARLNANGSLDTTFHVGTGASANTISIAIAPSGKIYLGGMPIYNGDTVNRIVRLNTDGTRDTSFHSGTGLNNYPYEFLLQADGKIVISGSFTSYNGASMVGVLRIDSTGNRDTSFTIGAGLAGGIVHHASLDLGGRYLFLGEFTLADNFVHFGGAKLNGNGSIYHDFMPSQFSNSNIRQVATQSDGKVLVAGEYTKFKDKDIRYLARLNKDGTLDTTFNMGTGPNGVLYAVSVQPDDKILIGGNFTSYNGKSSNRIARLNSDGSFDTTFNIGSGFSGYVLDIEILPSGKIFVGGPFTNYNGINVSKIILFNADGSRDNTFSPPTFNIGQVTNLLPMPDGKVVASGDFTLVNGAAHNSIIKLHSTGAIDTSFRGGTGFDGSSSGYMPLLLRPDGKIVVGFGGSRLIDGVTRGRIARLHPNGRIDTSFDAGNVAIAGPSVFDLESVNTGILVSGNFPGFIKYLDGNGAADATNFAANGASGGSLIYGMCKDDRNGRIIAAGVFWSFAQMYAAHTVALRNDIENPTISGPVCRGGVTKVYFDKRLTFNSGNVFTVQLSDSLGSFASPVAIGTDTMGGWGPDSVQVGIPMYKGNGTGYKVRIVSTDPVFTGAGSDAFTVGPIPAPVITADSIFCYGDSIQLSSSAADTYTWSTGDTTKDIWVDTSGTYTVSVSLNNCTATSTGKQITERTIQPPVAPTTQIGCSDSTYTFVFDSIYAGTYGNQVQWSYSSTFGTAQTIVSGGTIALPNLGEDTTIWVRSRDSIRGCVSIGVSTKATVRPHPAQKNISVLRPEVYAGLNAYIRVANTQPGVYYQPLIDTVAMAGEYGNGDTIHISGGRIYGPTTYRVAAIDTNGCSVVMADTVSIDTVAMTSIAWYKYRNTAQNGAALESIGNTTIVWPLKNYALGLNSNTKTTEGMYDFRFVNGHSFEGLIGLVPDVANGTRGLRILIQHQATGMSIAKGVYLIDSNENYYFLGGIKDTAALNLKIHKTGKGFRIYKDDVYGGYYPMDTSLTLYPFAAPFTAGSVLAGAATDIAASLHAETSPQHIGCGTNAGSATIHAYGGTPPYNYNWSNGDTSITADSLNFGTYTVTVTDADTNSVQMSVDIAYSASWDTLVNTSVDTLGGFTGLSPQGTFHSYGLAANTLPGGTDGWAEWQIAEGDTFQGAFFMINNPYIDESTDGISVAITGDMVFAEGTGLDGPSYIGSYQAGRNYRFRIAVSDSGFAIYKSMGNGTPTLFFVPAGTGYDIYPGASPVTAGSRLASLTVSFGCGKLRTRARVIPAETATGTATVQMDVKGGVPPYTYAWSNSATAATINVSPGTYTVTVTDAGAQSATASVFAGAYVAWNKLANVTESIDRSLACTADGDMGAYQLGNHAFAQNALEPGQDGNVQFGFASGTDFCGYAGLSNDYLGAGGSKGLGAFLVQERLGIEGLEPGLYYIDGEGGIGYMGQLRANVPVSVGFERYGDTIDIVKNGLGRISLVLPTPYRLHPLASPLFAGDKVGRITADFGAPLQLEYDAAHVACAGGISGSINTNLFGGTAPYSYHWSTGDTMASADSLAVGIYTLTVYDAGGDTLIETFEIGYKTEWDTLVKLATDTSGALAVQGNMAVTAFDNHGFGLNSLAPVDNGWAEFILPEGPVFAGALGLADNRYYDESSLGIAFNVEGGSIYVNVNGQELQELEDYRAGAGYRLRIQLVGDSAKMHVADLHGYNGGTIHTFYCPRSTYLSPLVAVGRASAKIAAVNTSFGCGKMHVELRTQAAEKNGSTGNIYTEVKGGTPPYSYHWSNSANTANLTGVTIGSYTLTVTDAAADTVTISTFLGRYVDWDIMANTYEDTSHKVICTGDTLDQAISISNYAFAKNTVKPGETGTVSFDFEKSLQYAGNVGLGQDGAFQSTGFYALIVPEGYITGLDQALYVVGDEGIEYFGKLRDSLPLNLKFYKDAAGVTVTKNGLGSILLAYTDPITLSPAAAPGWNGHTISRATCDFGKRLQLAPQVGHLGCGETNTGAIAANASGGTPPYTYSWNNGDTTDSRDSLVPGIYNVTVTDAASDTVAQSITVAYQTAWDTLNGFEGDSNHIITATEVYGTAQSLSVLPASSDGWFEFGIPPGAPFSGIFSLADQANIGDAANGFAIYIGNGSIHLIHSGSQGGDFIGNYTSDQGHRFRLQAAGDTIKVTKWDYYRQQAPVEYTYAIGRFLCLRPGVMALETGSMAAPVLASYGCSASYDTTIAGGVLAASADTICRGGGVTLVLSGYSGTIRWQAKAEGDNYWADMDTLSNPTNDTIVITDIQQTMRFRAVISGGGCGNQGSNIWTTVLRDQAGRVGILNGACGPVDTLVLGDVLALEGSYTYQWMHSIDGYTYSDIAGATSASYNVADAQQQTGWFRRRAKDGAKCLLNSNTIKMGL